MTSDLESAVKAASARWKACFNAGDAAGCASCYEDHARMVAKPLGTFAGRAAIEGFWRRLIEGGYADVAYVDPAIEVLDEGAAVLTSDWTMNKAQGVITQEIWVKQDDGEMLLREDHFEVQG